MSPGWRGRGLGALVVALAVMGSCAVATAAPRSPRQGTFAGRVDIGGARKLYLRCAGHGNPTVILESGIHDSSDPWTLTDTTVPVPSSPAVFTGVSRFTHVCLYDRPGTIRYTTPLALTARSTPVTMPRALPAMAADLHALIHRAGIRTPVILTPHSMGGMIDRYYAQTYRKDVAGMVLVDAFGRDIKRLFGSLWPAYDHLLNFPGTTLDFAPGWERIDIDGAIRAVQRARPLPRMPLAVISKTEPFGLPPGTPKDIAATLLRVWPIGQNALVKLEPQTPHILATGSDHYVQLHDPDLVTSVIRLILDRVRGHGRR